MAYSAPTSDFITSTLNGAIVAGATSMTIGTGLDLPAANGILTIDYDSSTAMGADNGPETISYTAYNSGTGAVTGMTRGLNGTTGVAHGNGASVCAPISASHIVGIIDMSSMPSTPKLVNRQDDTTNGAVSNQLIQTGWGWVIGGNSITATEAVTFPVAFDSAPIVIVTQHGYKADSNPAAIGELTGVFNAQSVVLSANTVTATGFNARVTSDTGTTIANNIRIGYTWIAIGTKAR